jgi:hypothetical protein
VSAEQLTQHLKMTNDYFRQTRATNGLIAATPIRRRSKKRNRLSLAFSWLVLIAALSFIGSPWIDKQIDKAISSFESMVASDDDYITYIAPNGDCK